MRDGIPGKLPVPPKYREAVACADRPADKGTPRVTEKFAIAILDDLQKSFALIKGDLKKFSAPANPTLPGFEVGISQRPEGSHRIDELLDDVKKATSEGSQPDKAVLDALKYQVGDLLESRLRSVRENLAPEVSPAEFKEINSEIQRAVASLNVDSVARSFLDGSPVATPVSDDEDLRGPSARK
jgi:hypothetical protein